MGTLKVRKVWLVLLGCALLLLVLGFSSGRTQQGDLVSRYPVELKLLSNGYVDKAGGHWKLSSWQPQDAAIESQIEYLKSVYPQAKGWVWKEVTSPDGEWTKGEPRFFRSFYAENPDGTVQIVLSGGSRVPGLTILERVSPTAYARDWIVARGDIEPRKWSGSLMP